MLRRHYATFLMLATVALLIVASTGCMGAMSQLMYVIKGHQIDPAYPGLVGKRVAVVCVSDASAYGPDTLTYTVAQAVSIRLSQSVDEIEVVSPGKIENWIDQNGWNESEFVELGKGIDADIVLAIEVASYSIHEGSTMYKGRADITATVYDIEKNGQVPFVYGPKHFAFPENGRPAIQTSEREFEALYLAQLTINLTNQFAPHDKLESFANDAIMAD
jgi:hypothetical protein